MSRDAEPKTPSPAAPSEVAREDDRFGEDRERVVALFGDTSRSGGWLPPERLDAIAGFGNVRLDFTRADLPPGPTEVVGWAVFGNVDLRVPAHLDVELNGVSVFGKITHRSDRKAGRKLFDRVLPKPPPPPHPAPEDGEDRWLVVKGWAVFGNVRITTVDP